MPAQYSIAGNFAVTTTTAKTATTAISIAGLRPQIYGFGIGAFGAPNSTDCSMVWALQICTTAGTTTAVTPYPLDPRFGAASTIGGSNASAEPTYTAGAVPWTQPLNQRASQILWLPVNAPVTLVGTASNGAGMTVLSTNYAGQSNAILYVQE